MRRPEDLPPNIYVYRRIPAEQWDQPTGRVNSGAFKDKHDRLSVYLADAQTPRGVLQLRLDTWAELGREAALMKHGRTLEELVNGPRRWRVFRIPLGILTGVPRLSVAGVNGEVPDDGHIEVCGDPSPYYLVLVKAAELLDAAVCVAEDPGLSPLADWHPPTPDPP